MLPLAATDYPFLEILGSLLFFFCFVIWLGLLFTLIGDLFRRHDVGGWGKAAWVVLLIVLPFLGALIYLGMQGEGMAERKAQAAAASEERFAEYVRRTAASGADAPATQISQAKQLLDSGAIDQGDFDALKRRALA